MAFQLNIEIFINVAYEPMISYGMADDPMSELYLFCQIVGLPESICKNQQTTYMEGILVGDMTKFTHLQIFIFTLYQQDK